MYLERFATVGIYLYLMPVFNKKILVQNTRITQFIDGILQNYLPYLF